MLLRELNFRVPPELAVAAGAIVKGIQAFGNDDPNVRSAWVEYANISERVVETSETAVNPTTYDEAQIAVIIHKSLIFQRVSNWLRYIEELDSADVYAFNMGLDEVSSTIQTEIDAIIDTLEMSPGVLVIKLKGFVSEINREHLRDLIDQGDDLEDMIGNVYGMILEEGGDPDEVLAELGVLDVS